MIAEALVSRPERLREFRRGTAVWYWYRSAPPPLYAPSLNDILMILDFVHATRIVRAHNYYDVLVLRTDCAVETMYNCVVDDFLVVPNTIEND